MDSKYEIHNKEVNKRIEANWKTRQLLISYGCVIEADGLLRFNNTFFCPKTTVKYFTGEQF